jgi:4-hydroxyphenylacetate 3-monooxygenase
MAALRTGSEYLRSLNDGRQVFVDGECVADVSRHKAFREAARSVARLYDIAAEPENRELMTFTSPKTGAPVLRAYPDPEDPCRSARSGGCSRKNGRRRRSA